MKKYLPLNDLHFNTEITKLSAIRYFLHSIGTVKRIIIRSENATVNTSHLWYVLYQLIGQSTADYVKRVCMCI